MKILLLNNLFTPYQRGGAERIVELSAQEFRAAGHSVKIVCTYPKNARRKDEELENVFYLPSNYYHLSEKSFAYRFFWQLTNLFNCSQAKRLRKIFEQEKPDLVIAHNLMGLGGFVPKLIKRQRSKLILTLHDIQWLHPSGLLYFGQEKIIDSLPAKIYQLLGKCLLKNGPKDTRIIAPSAWLLNLYQERGFFKNQTCVAIPNPLSLSKDLTLPRQKQFLFIGQAGHHKGLDLFLKAATKFPAYTFAVIGEHSEKSFESNVKFLGRLSSPAVSEELAQSLALVVPSRCYENSPTVIYEAQQTKTPVIAAALGGIPELIERWGGLLFEPDNLASLITALNYFIKEGAPLKTPPLPPPYGEQILNLVD